MSENTTQRNIQTEIYELWKEDFKSNLQELDNFAKYIYKACAEKDKKNKYTQWWLRDTSWNVKKAEVFYDLFKEVANEWLWLDGKHITIQSTGLSYDYIAYKNKMLLAYPETIIDLQLVYEWDDTEFCKDNGKIEYTHKLKNPFSKKDEEIIWGYCIIKNKRWEFLVTLTRDDFEVAKAAAKGDFIWKKFYAAMCMKTLIKRACKMHFSDMYEKMDNEDNKQNDLDQLQKTQKEQEETSLEQKQLELQQKYKDIT